MFAMATTAIEACENIFVSSYASYVLSEIKAALVSVDTTGLPRLWAGNDEDGAILFEWIFADGRLGFNIESGLPESSWYIVTKPGISKI